MRRDPSQQVTKLRHFDRSSTKLTLWGTAGFGVCARACPWGETAPLFPVKISARASSDSSLKQILRILLAGFEYSWRRDLNVAGSKHWAHGSADWHGWLDSAGVVGGATLDRFK